MASFASPLTRDGTGTVRRREITLSAREKQVYGQLWAAADTDNSGFITGADAVPFFAKSGLPPQILGQIWVLADSDNKGVLGQQGFSIAVKLIAHAQNGKTPSPSLINTDAPLPHFEGLTAPTSSESPTSGSTSSAGITSHSTGSEPAVTNEDKNKYGGMFVACGPVNGLLDGDKAREVFLKSKLPVDKLSQIWSLADTKSRGSLDITDFTIAMYYIQHTMDGSIPTLPATLPPSILKACSGAAPGGGGSISSPVMSSQTLSRQVTGNNISLHNPVVARQMTGSVSMTSSPLAKQNTGGALGTGNLFGSPSVSAELPWDVTPEEKAKFDRFFDQLDTNGDGIIGGEEAGKFFMNSRLPESVLAQIWDLSDITGSGSLSKDEFAVAMLLINRKNASNAPIPKTLPLSLVPPSLRNRASALSFASQEPLRNISMSAGRSPQYRRQSFDLLGDGPMTSSVSTGITSTSDKDLIGTEDLTSKMTSETGELASMQNQINNLGKVTGDLQAKRAILEKNLSALSAQKQDFSIRLNQIKTLHENETKTIKDLENALGSIQPQLIKLRDELVTSERELAVARQNKDEFLLTLAKDQEENAQIKTRLRQNNEETVRLREELEAKKKDTGRQKSLLEIARRQLAASDADKQKIVNEIEQEVERATQAAQQLQSLSTSSPASSSPVPPPTSSGSTSGPPPPPAPRGSRKEPPPPPASRSTGSNNNAASAFALRVSPEAEEAFGIPPALRSPTGSFHSVHSPRMVSAAPPSISRQSTGSSPFDPIPRQGTGSSAFEPVARQGTGSSAFEPIPRQGTGMSAKAPSIASVSESNNNNNNNNNSPFLAAPTPAGDDIWSPLTHAAHANMVGHPETTTSPEPENPEPGMMSLGMAASQVPTSPPLSTDPFGSMAFPAMDTPPVTKMDFDSAFTGFGGPSSKPAASSSSLSNDGGVKSAEAFAQEFPDIDAVGESAEGSSKASKRVSAFGFDDDFSAGSSPFGQTLEKSKEEDEFPPIVEMVHPDEDSTDEEDSDDDDEQVFEQAKSSIASPEPAEDVVAAAAPAPAPAPVVASNTGTRKLTSADFGEFETSFGESAGGDDFESAFKGVELGTSKKVGTVPNMAGFDDGFDFNSSSFDDAFGPPASSSLTPFGNTAAAPPTSSSSASFGASFNSPFGQDSFGDAFNPGAAGNKATTTTAGGALDLDEAFGGFGATATAPPPASSGAAPDYSRGGFGDSSSGFGDFEQNFAASSSSSSVPVPATTSAPSSSSAISPRPVPAIPAATSAVGEPAAGEGMPIVPPQADLLGVDELMSMGFTRQQSNDALARYDNVERAANFLLEGGGQ